MCHSCLRKGWPWRLPVDVFARRQAYITLGISYTYKDLWNE